MGVSPSVPFLLISAILLVSFTQGFGRDLAQTIEHEENSTLLLEEKAGISPEDYEDPGPNTNPKSVVLPPPSLVPKPGN